MGSIPFAVVLVELVSLTSNLLQFLAYAQSDITRLRQLSMAANVVFIGYAVFKGSFTYMVETSAGIVILAYKMVQEARLARELAAAAEGGMRFEWLRPFMVEESVSAGTVLFRQGDQADRAYSIVTGRVRIVEFDIVLEAGDVFGEMALFLDEGRRNATAVALEACRLRVIDYRHMIALFVQNRAAGFQLIRLIVARAHANADRSRSAALPSDPVSPPLGILDRSR